jgi:hypothetical protein
MSRIHATDRRQLELRNGAQPSERRTPGWLGTLRDPRLLRTERRKTERRTGFDRRARVQPAHPALRYVSLWAHN